MISKFDSVLLDSRTRHACGPVRRQGVAFVLITAMLFVFVVSAAFTINYSYMQLVRTELRAATDAAAKAGAETLARTEDTTLARQEAIRYAAANRVGGQPFLLGNSDVEFGRVSSAGSGRWSFTSGGNSLNAVRINARTGNGAANAAIPLFFSSVLGRSSFTPAYSATAGQQQVEVCLCLDRSGSMLFDMTGTDYSYPPNNPRL
jgi:Ca-activated chloride channel homolog